eukprot:COSAG01_NODE_11935_length_1831_cov_9.472286_1_plen_83_part_00
MPSYLDAGRGCDVPLHPHPLAVGAPVQPALPCPALPCCRACKFVPMDVETDAGLTRPLLGGGACRERPAKKEGLMTYSSSFI